jgi:energy-coupling factor transport system ATP-binding protein
MVQDAPTACLASPLVVEDLSFCWSTGHPALRHCNLQIPRAGLWMLVGSNGSGKSTLLRCIAGLLQPQEGRINTPLRPALVFQNPDHQLLLPSCGSDLMIGLRGPMGTDQRQQAVLQALGQVGLLGFEQRPIHTLSGGQKQRLAIAGTLAAQADLLLLDEPTALLDPESQREVLHLIRRLCSDPEKPLTALWITHRLEELDLCDGAALMQGGRVGPWCGGAGMRRQLAPLPEGQS